MYLYTKLKLIASCITAPQYAEYQELFNPNIITAITINDLKNVLINTFEVGINQIFIYKMYLFFNIKNDLIRYLFMHKEHHTIQFQC